MVVAGQKLGLGETPVEEAVRLVLTHAGGVWGKEIVPRAGEKGKFFVALETGTRCCSSSLEKRYV